MPWPPDADLLAAWQQLRDDPTAGNAFIDLVHRPLVDELLARHRRIDPDIAYTAASNALLWFAEHPANFDPARSPLHRFLTLVGERRLLNLLDAESRHHRRRIFGDHVEHAADPRNDEGDADTPSSEHPQLQHALARLSEVDRQVWELMTSGERRSEAFAAVLGITHLPPDDLRREVKRAKDRITARLKRAVGGSDG